MSDHKTGGVVKNERWRTSTFKRDYGDGITESYAGCTTCGDHSARWHGARAESLAQRHARKHGHVTWFRLLGWRSGKFDGR